MAYVFLSGVFTGLPGLNRTPGKEPKGTGDRSTLDRSRHCLPSVPSQAGCSATCELGT